MFWGSFKETVSVFQGNLKKASRVFQECFNEVLFDKFFVAEIISQLPEQKACFYGGRLFVKLHLSHCICHIAFFTLCLLHYIFFKTKVSRNLSNLNYIKNLWNIGCKSAILAGLEKIRWRQANKQTDASWAAFYFKNKSFQTVDWINFPKAFHSVRTTVRIGQWKAVLNDSLFLRILHSITSHPSSPRSALVWCSLASSPPSSSPASSLSRTQATKKTMNRWLRRLVWNSSWVEPASRCWEKV